jgi:hypothetical protein
MVPILEAVGKQQNGGHDPGVLPDVPPPSTGVKFSSGILVVLLLFAAGCETTVPPPMEPLAIRPIDLVRAYRDSPDVARVAYTGSPVIIPLTTYTKDGDHLLWHIGSPDYPPAIVCELAEPLPPTKAVVWVRGVCIGRVDDGIKRESPGVTFHVRVTDCRIAPPPSMPAPAPR